MLSCTITLFNTFTIVWLFSYMLWSIPYFFFMNFNWHWRTCCIFLCEIFSDKILFTSFITSGLSNTSSMLYSFSLRTCVCSLIFRQQILNRLTARLYFTGEESYTRLWCVKLPLLLIFDKYPVISVAYHMAIWFKYATSTV